MKWSDLLAQVLDIFTVLLAIIYELRAYMSTKQYPNKPFWVKFLFFIPIPSTISGPRKLSNGGRFPFTSSLGLDSSATS